MIGYDASERGQVEQELNDWVAGQVAAAEREAEKPRRPFRIIPNVDSRDKQRLRRAAERFDDLGMGEDAPFVRVGRNQYGCRDNADAHAVARSMMVELGKAFAYDVVWDG